MYTFLKLVFTVLLLLFEGTMNIHGGPELMVSSPVDSWMDWINADIDQREQSPGVFELLDARAGA